MSNRLRVLTYNIHKCRGLDGRVQPPRIVEVLREIDPDIIALQEVLSIPGSSSEEDQAQFIASQMGLHACLGENRCLNGGEYGNLLLNRFPLLATENHDISIPGRERRGCLRADIALKTTLHLFNVHLGTSFFERRLQARKLVSAQILHNPDLYGVRLILGDFNEWTRGLATHLLSRNLQRGDGRNGRGYFPTFPALLPVLDLDHMYFDPALKLERLTVHRSRNALIASDHLPLVADFRLDSSATAANRRYSRPINASALTSAILVRTSERSLTRAQTQLTELGYC